MSLAEGCSEVKHFYSVISDDGVGVCVKLRRAVCAGVLVSIAWSPSLFVSNGG